MYFGHISESNLDVGDPAIETGEHHPTEPALGRGGPVAPKRDGIGGEAMASEVGEQKSVVVCRAERTVNEEKRRFGLLRGRRQAIKQLKLSGSTCELG